MTPSTAASASVALGRSIGPLSRSRYSGSRIGPAASSRTMTGTPIRKADPHQKYSSSAPPTRGPSAAPARKLVNQIEIATVRCAASGNMLRISARVEGASVAPATPSSARAVINISALVENAARTDARPNAAAPISSSRRRPIRSPRVPIVIRNPAIMNP
jgi:hypothetical protein